MGAEVGSKASLVWVYNISDDVAWNYGMLFFHLLTAEHKTER